MTFWSQPVPAVAEAAGDQSMLLSSDAAKHASQLQMDDWAPSFESKGWTRDGVMELFGTFSQYMGQELRTYEQIYQHVCMAEIASKRQVQADIDPIWIAQHAAYTPKQITGAVPDPNKDTGWQDPQALASAVQHVQGEDCTQQLQASALPRAQLHEIAEAARVAWKDAVEQRRKAVSDWDDYVRFKHNEYDQAKTNLKNCKK